MKGYNSQKKIISVRKFSCYSEKSYHDECLLHWGNTITVKKSYYCDESVLVIYHSFENSFGGWKVNIVMKIHHGDEII